MTPRLPPFNPDDPKLIGSLKVLFGFYLLMALLGVGVWFTTGIGNFGARDFIQFWSASHMALAGEGIAAYDPEALSHTSRIAVADSYIIYFWRYPPTALLLYFPLALLPYHLAWMIFTILTTALLVVMLRRIVNIPLVLWVTLTSPALALNAWNGQNGTLNASMLAAALLTMVKRPLLSALSATALACKPHLIPALLLAELLRARKVLAFTICAIALSAAAATLCFSPAIWQAWRGSLPTQYVAADSADVMEMLGRMSSLFASARLMGFGIEASWAIHLTLATSALIILIILWRRDIPFERKAAAVPIVALLLPPYVFYYDYVLILTSLAFWMAHIKNTREIHGELHLMALVWATPIWLGCISLHAIPLPQIILFAALVFLLSRSDFSAD